ncbi:MAG TPA: polysaccharide biosynthesis/export family protein [Candidatus Binataceae bacterium]|nr:polysaccharide biosynthesis/export family protein [Candidatus Binataceae bacterium]
MGMRKGILGLALCALTLCGCSAAASRGDTRGGARTANLSPEQCMNGGAIQRVSERQGYYIQPGDQLAINFYLNPEFNDEVPVSPGGRITLRLIGTIPAAGMTPAQLAAQIDKDYLSELRSPDAVVVVKNMPGRQVYVQGQVNHPGAFPLQPGMTALQALAEAGGVTADAADDSVVLIRRDACGRSTGERLDLASAIDSPSSGENAGLMPYDVLVVPRSRIANIDLFVQHYIRGVLPIEPYLSFPGPPL